MAQINKRCRLVLVAPDIADPAVLSGVIGEALSGGDVASVILPQRKIDDASFQRMAESAIPVIQSAGAAALVAGDSRVAGRARADGLHLACGASEMKACVERYAPQLIVGGGNARDRHSALAIGEGQPDYVMFGAIDGDIKPEPHPKNLALAQWWADMIEIPCMVMGGTCSQFAVEIAATGADFVAFGRAVFDAADGAGHMVRRINQALDEKAPRFD